MSYPTPLLALQAQVDSLPALPSIVTKVLAITANPESSADDLIRAILPDQSMCTAILKIANSALYGLPKRVSSMERAMVVLGQEEVKNIVIGKALFTAFPRMGKENREQLGLFWAHAFSCGLAAKIIADDHGLSRSELFLAGLIHDIGKLVMLMAFPSDYSPLRELGSPDHSQHLEAELSRFSVSHDQLGRLLAAKLLLPEPLEMAIGFHHSPNSAPSHRYYATIIQVADMLALLSSRGDIAGEQEAAKVFAEYLPEPPLHFPGPRHSWQELAVGRWYTNLLQQREQDHELLSFFKES